MADQSTPLKGVAFNLGFTLYKNDGTVVANPGTYVKKVWKDGGAAADIAAAVVETDTTYGVCYLALSAAEMTADRVQVYITDNTAGTVPFSATLYPAASSVVANVTTIMGKTNSMTFTVAGKQDVNVYTWNGTAVATPATAGVPDVNIKNIANAVVNAAVAQIGVNVVNWKGVAAAAMTGDAYARLGATPPTAAGIADAVWDEVLNVGHAVANSAAVISSAQATASVLAGVSMNVDNVYSVLSNVTFGLSSLHDSIVAIPAAPTAAAIATATWVNGTRALTDKVGFSGVATNMVADAPTTVAIRTELAAELGRLDTAVSSRLATAGYTAPPSIVALATEANATANKNTVVAAMPAAAPTVAAVADAVWDEVLTSGHAVVGSAAVISSAQATAATLATVLAKTNLIPASPAAVGSNMGSVASVTAPVALTGAYDAAKTALQSGGSVVASNMRGTDAALLAVNYTTPPAMRGTDNAMLASSYVAPPTALANADAVWDEVLNVGHAVANSAAVVSSAQATAAALALVKADTVTIIASVAANQTDLNTVITLIDTEVAAIKTDTVSIITKADANQTDLNTLITNVAAVKTAADANQADCNTIITNVAAVKVDTTGIRTDTVLLRKARVNKRDTTNGQDIVLDDDGITPIITQVISDNGTTASRSASS